MVSTQEKLIIYSILFQLISERFLVEEIPQDRQDSHFRSDDIHIMKFTRLKS